ncbi:hypothetical protein EDB86DRAFT_2826827 [Lactarius hatsudake]|nr:hypothetical protein EDB86DRAFT_2826827 [Lactarius hatsudake]
MTNLLYLHSQRSELRVHGQWSPVTLYSPQCNSRYVHESVIETFGGVAARQTILSTGRIGRAWAANYTIVDHISSSSPSLIRRPELQLPPCMGPLRTGIPQVTTKHDRTGNSG